MAAAAPATTHAPPRTWPKWLPIAGFSVLGLLAATLAVYLLTITFGAVHGVEFSPQTFERRSYSLYELPLIGIQVTAKRHDDLTGAAENYLLSKKHIKPQKNVPQQWHVVVGVLGASSNKGDASILMQYLDATDANDDQRWVKWSEDHPKLADVFWPEVQRLASHELYVFLPELFELTKRHDEPAKLKAAANKLVADKLLFLAKRLIEQEKHADAKKVLDEAAKLDPGNPEIVDARKSAAVAAQSAASKEAAGGN